MDEGVNSTQKIVIMIAILIGILVLIFVGTSLYNRAKSAESELANKTNTAAATTKQSDQASVSITGDAQNSKGFSFENFFGGTSEKKVTETDNFGVIDNSAYIPAEEPVVATTTPVVKKVTTPVYTKKNTTTYVNYDRPLTAEEIRRIRQLPVDNSPTGNLQTKLEVDSQGQYKAQYK